MSRWRSSKREPTDEALIVVIRPLADITKAAERLGFKLEWRERKIQGKLRRFYVRMSPTDDHATAAVIAASGDPELSTITTRLDYLEGRDDLGDIARETAEAAVERVREVLA